MGGIIGSYGQSDLMRGNPGKQQETGSLYQRSRGYTESSFDVRGNGSGTGQNDGFGRVSSTETSHGYGYIKNPEERKRGYGGVSESEKNRGYGRLGGAGSSSGVSGVRRAPSETMQRDKLMGIGGRPSDGAGFPGGSRPSGSNIRPIIKPNF